MPAKKKVRPPRSREGRPNLSLNSIAQIVVALFLREGSCKTIAEKYGCSERTVESIKAELPENLCGTSADTQEIMGQLLLAYTQESVTTAIAILQDLRSPDKLAQQSVAESLSIFGAASDRIFLLVQAAERAKQNFEQPQLTAGVEVLDSDGN